MPGEKQQNLQTNRQDSSAEKVRVDEQQTITTSTPQINKKELVDENLKTPLTLRDASELKENVADLNLIVPAKHSIHLSPFESLPKDVHWEALQQLGMHPVLTMRQINSRWKQLADNSLLWKNFFLQNQSQLLQSDLAHFLLDPTIALTLLSAENIAQTNAETSQLSHEELFNCYLLYAFDETLQTNITLKEFMEHRIELFCKPAYLPNGIELLDNRSEIRRKYLGKSTAKEWCDAWDDIVQQARTLLSHYKYHSAKRQLEIPPSDIEIYPVHVRWLLKIQHIERILTTFILHAKYKRDLCNPSGKTLDDIALDSFAHPKWSRQLTKAGLLVISCKDYTLDYLLEGWNKLLAVNPTTLNAEALQHHKEKLNTLERLLSQLTEEEWQIHIERQSSQGKIPGNPKIVNLLSDATLIKVLTSLSSPSAKELAVCLQTNPNLLNRITIPFIEKAIKKSFSQKFATWVLTNATLLTRVKDYADSIKDEKYLLRIAKKSTSTTENAALVLKSFGQKSILNGDFLTSLAYDWTFAEAIVDDPTILPLLTSKHIATISLEFHRADITLKLLSYTSVVQSIKSHHLLQIALEYKEVILLLLDIIPDTLKIPSITLDSATLLKKFDDIIYWQLLKKKYEKDKVLGPLLTKITQKIEEIAPYEEEESTETSDSEAEEEIASYEEEEYTKTSDSEAESAGRVVNEIAFSENPLSLTHPEELFGDEKRSNNKSLLPIIQPSTIPLPHASKPAPKEVLPRNFHLGYKMGWFFLLSSMVLSISAVALWFLPALLPAAIVLTCLAGVLALTALTIFSVSNAWQSSEAKPIFPLNANLPKQKVTYSQYDEITTTRNPGLMTSPHYQPITSASTTLYRQQPAPSSYRTSVASSQTSSTYSAISNKANSSTTYQPL